MRLHVKHALKAERLIQTLLREWAPVPIAARTQTRALRS